MINTNLTLFSAVDFDVIELDNNIHQRIKVRPMYFESGFSPVSHIFARRVVVNKLLEALNFLPSQYGFLIWDVYRPRLVQKKLFDWMREEIRKRSPWQNDQKNYEEAQKYMSLPSKIGDEYCPPHLSGGAIDLTLYDLSVGKELEMGTQFDDCTELAHSHYYNSRVSLTSNEEIIKKRRDLLRTTMERVGFASYQYEWWHFDIGNIFWSRITGFPAVFGPLFGDEEWPPLGG